MIVSLFIIKPRYNEKERNEKIKIGKNVFISTLFVQIIKFAIAGFTIYDVLYSITISILALVFYKIFVNSLVVAKEIHKNKAFSIEEVIGASLLLAIAVGGLNGINILGFSITNILKHLKIIFDI